MNERRIALGLLAWFLGVVVPVYVYVEALIGLYPHRGLAPNQVAAEVLDNMPWFVWLYYIPASLAGLLLVCSGLGFGRKSAANPASKD